MENSTTSLERSILAFTLSVIALYMFLSSQSRIFPFIREGKRLNVLVLTGREKASSPGLNYIAVFSYEPKARFLDVLRLPPQTKVNCSREIAARGYGGLGEIYSRVYQNYRNTKETSLCVKKLVEELLGMEIPFYLYTNCQMIPSVPELFSDKKENRKEITGSGNFRLEKKATLVNRGRDPGYYRKNPRILYGLWKFLDELSMVAETNLNSQDFFLLADEVRNFSYWNLRIQNLPGEWQDLRGVRYWIPDREMVDETVQVICNSYRIKRKMPVAFLSAVRFSPIVKVEVWNASGRKGLAYQVQRKLREYGIDAVRWGNYGISKRFTTVVDRKGNIELAERVARFLGSQIVKTEIDSTRLVDLSIILGADFPRWEKQSEMSEEVIE